MTDPESSVDTRKMAADPLHRRALPAALPEERSRAAGCSLAEVYEAQVGYVFRCLRSLGLQGSALDDAVQDVFMVVQQKLAMFDGRAQLRTWLYAIVVRVARRYRSRYAQDKSRFVDTDTAGDDTHSEAELDHKQRLALAQRALNALDHDKREVFVLAQIEEMSAPEIAQVIGLPLNTVYSRLRAARIAFAQQVERLQRRERRSAAWR